MQPIYFFYYLMIASNHTLIIYKRTKLVAFNSFLGAAINILLNYLLIPIYGLTGAAVATGISFIIIALLYSLESYKITNIFPYKPVYFKIILSTMLPILFLLGAKFLFNLSNLILLLVTLSVSVLLYFISLVLTNSFEKEDLMLINSLGQKTKLKLNFLLKLISK